MFNVRATPTLLCRSAAGYLIACSITLLAYSAFSTPASAQARRPSTGSLKVITGNAESVVFINNIRHGVTNEEGVLDLPAVWAGTYPVRIRTAGFTDWTGRVSIAARARRVLRVNQQPTSDRALIHYQKAEALRDKGKDDAAIPEYAAALEQRPVYPEARIAMARSLITRQRFDQAEEQLRTAMQQHRAPYPEAQTILANMRRYQGLIAESIEEYEKALKLTRGVSPEANIGLAIALEEAGEMDEAIERYRKGIAQDMDTEPILYYLLASALEKEQRYKEAIEAYRNYLRLAPQGVYASAVASMIERLKEEMDGTR